MKRKNDGWAVVGGVLFLIFFLVCMAGGIYIHFGAPCKDIEWLPVKELPSRCLTFVK